MSMYACIKIVLFIVLICAGRLQSATVYCVSFVQIVSAINRHRHRLQDSKTERYQVQQLTCTALYTMARRPSTR